jgi:hypothetical protein
MNKKMSFPKEIENMILDYAFADYYECPDCDLFLNIEMDYQWQYIDDHQIRHYYEKKYISNKKRKRNDNC